MRAAGRANRSLRRNLLEGEVSRSDGHCPAPAAAPLGSAWLRSAPPPAPLRLRAPRPLRPVPARSLALTPSRASASAAAPRRHRPPAPAHNPPPHGRGSPGKPHRGADWRRPSPDPAPTSRGSQSGLGRARGSGRRAAASSLRCGGGRGRRVRGGSVARGLPGGTAGARRFLVAGCSPVTGTTGLRGASCPSV